MAFLLNTLIITLLSIVAFTSLIYGQENSTGKEPVSRVCLGCICEAASGCNITIGCDGSVCGPFRITWAYWADAGKPIINDSMTQDAYPRCVNDVHCAARTVENYMWKYGQDCNGDGIINCDDYVRIHQLGAYGCTSSLNSKFENIYKHCMQTFQNQ
ncbi:lysozyme 2-like [Bombus impatiens]|uniref:lysozyme n=1 Tax=Bombus impatiens TaxID=132113 RepID=A0A6P3DSG7_BOMIM|nr:lysozyme 2-like [Bombus impatiens]